MSTNTTVPTGVVSSTELGKPIAYLYHDTSTPKDAHPWLHRTMLVLAADLREWLRGETPLVTLDQAEAMVAAERERCAKLCEGMHCEDGPHAYAWAIRTKWAPDAELPNTEGKRPAQGTDAGPV